MLMLSFFLKTWLTLIYLLPLNLAVITITLLGINHYRVVGIMLLKALI